MATAIDKPGIYLSEIRQCLLEEHGTDVTISTICKFLHKEAGSTRQKMVLTAKQRSESLRAQYLLLLWRMLVIYSHIINFDFPEGSIFSHIHN